MLDAQEEVQRFQGPELLSQTTHTGASLEDQRRALSQFAVRCRVSAVCKHRQENVFVGNRVETEKAGSNP